MKMQRKTLTTQEYIDRAEATGMLPNQTCRWWEQGHYTTTHNTQIKYRALQIKINNKSNTLKLELKSGLLYFTNRKTIYIRECKQGHAQQLQNK